MKRFVPLVALSLVAAVAGAGQDSELRRSVTHCATIAEDAERLACFDQAAESELREVPLAGWRVEQDAAGSGIRLVVDGSGELIGRHGRTRGRLELHCSGGKLEATIFTGMAAHPERGRDDHTILLRFDDDDLFSVPMKPSADGNALIVPWPVMTANRLLGHQRLYFQFVPEQSRPASTTFALPGLRELLETRLDACGLVRHEDGSLDRRDGG